MEAGEVNRKRKILLNTVPSDLPAVLTPRHKTFGSASVLYISK